MQSWDGATETGSGLLLESILWILNKFSIQFNWKFVHAELSELVFKDDLSEFMDATFYVVKLGILGKINYPKHVGIAVYHDYTKTILKADFTTAIVKFIVDFWILEL